jgi:hypothetical protein
MGVSVQDVLALGSSGDVQPPTLEPKHPSFPGKFNF